MVATSGSPAPLPPGFALQDGTLLDAILAIGQHSWANGLVAIGTTAPTALQLTQKFNNMAVVGSGTGVNLPQANGGNWVVINNGVSASGHTLAIYSSQTSTTDTIDGTAGTTGTTLSTANRAALFICFLPGAWTSFLLGAVSS